LFTSNINITEMIVQVTEMCSKAKEFDWENSFVSVKH